MLNRTGEPRTSIAALLTLSLAAWSSSAGAQPVATPSVWSSSWATWSVHAVSVVAVVALVMALRNVRLRQIVSRRTAELESKNLQLQRETAERMLALDAQRGSEARLRMALDAAQMRTWDWDVRTGSIQFGGGASEPRDAGMPARPIEAAFEMLHPADRERMRTALMRAVEGIPLDEEFRLLRPDGAVEWRAVRGTAFRDESGEVAGVAGVSQDISKRKRFEQELRHSEERYRELFENANDVVYTHDLSGNFLSVNKAAESVVGYTREEIAHINIASLVVPEQLALAREMIASKVAGDRAGTSYELEIITKQGRRIPLEVNTRLIRQNGDVIGVQGIGRDVSERKRLEAQLRQAQKMEAVGQLAGGIAHDFNNLLTAISCNTQLARLALAPSHALHEHLAEIEDAARRAASLTRQLLVFSRRQRLERKTVRLDEILREFLQMLGRIIGEDIRLEMRSDAFVSPVSADPTQIEQVVMNLAVNARDAMPSGGRLLLEAGDVELDADFCQRHEGATPGRYVRLRITDSGTGMDRKTLQRIFDPFFTTKAVGRGTGLGLAVVYGIVKQHDGHVEVESTPGEGSTFSIYLPAVTDRALVEPRESPTPALGGMETILVAEDEEALCRLTNRLLTSLGYTVLMSRDGEEAATLFRERRGEIDLALLDVVMPRRGGREVHDDIRAAGSGIPIIFMTGYSAEMAPAALAAETGCALIQKPYGVDAIAHLVRDALDGRLQDVPAPTAT